MKKILVLIILLSSLSLNAQEADQKVADLINSQNFIELKKMYPLLKDDLTYPMFEFLAEATIGNAFNQHQQAISAIDSLLIKHSQDLGMDNIVSFAIMKANQLEKLGRYKEAAQSLKILMDNCTDKNLLTKLKSVYNKHHGLSEVPKSEIIWDKSKSNVVKFETSTEASKHHWMVSGEINDKEESFMFDTGASSTIVSTSFAERHGIKTLADSVAFHNILSELVYDKIGVIDTLKIGNVTLTNVPTFITDNIIPKHDSIKYTIDAVIGSSFMEAVGSIKIEPKRDIMRLGSNLQSEESQTTPNISFNTNQLLTINVFYDDMPLNFICDTGGSFSGWIADASYQAYKGKFDKLDMKRDSIQVGGLGGEITKYYTYEINKIPLTIDGITEIHNDFSIIENESQIGILGFYFFKNLDEIIFDLNKMIFIAK